MSKYIIEIPDGTPYVLLRREEFGINKVVPVSELEELNSDYINEHYGELQDEAYQAGLNDAWKAVRKIALMDTETSENVTGYFGLFRIMENLTAMQAIEKLKAYEDKHSDRIEVGDEVISDTGTKFTVTGLANPDNACGISARGFWCFNTIDKLTKTGKHYDIQSILEAMRE